MSSAGKMDCDLPLQQLFASLTTRGSEQSQLRDRDVRRYLTNLLVDFVRNENIIAIEEAGSGLQYLSDMLKKSEESAPFEKPNFYKNIGDYTLFIVGLFPESLNRRHCISLNYYSELGRRCYLILSRNQFLPWSTLAVYRKLSDQFQSCVRTLNWVRNYVQDPFYQYMFRQFEIDKSDPHELGGAQWVA
jgi:hypothetical protein